MYIIPKIKIKAQNSLFAWQTLFEPIILGKTSAVPARKYICVVDVAESATSNIFLHGETVLVFIRVNL